MGGYDGRNKEYLGHKDWAVLNLSSMQWVRGAHYSPEDQAGAEAEQAPSSVLDEECAERHPEVSGEGGSNCSGWS